MKQIQEQPRSRGQLDAIYEAERRRFAEDQKDVHACMRLWRTVIERTVEDIKFLKRHGAEGKLKKHEEEQLRRIKENPPAEFVHGAWFEQICDYLQVSPARVRSAIVKIETSAA